jgi:hypothetical protein
MTSPLTEVVKAYTEYRIKRKAVQRRLRDELEVELAPDKVALGKALSEARSGGLSIADLSNAIDLKNRNFIYEMLNMYAVSIAVPAAPEIEQSEVVTPTVTEQETEPQWKLFSVNYDELKLHAWVTVFGREYTLVRITQDYPFTAPDEWANGTKEERSVYKSILKELNGN